jgi:hypothetical protein
MRIKIDGKHWNLAFVSAIGDKWGDCSPPDEVHKRIRIVRSLVGELLADVIIHEMTHGSQWNLSEDFVTANSSDMARVLCKPVILAKILNGLPDNTLKKLGKLIDPEALEKINHAQ